MKLHVSAFFLLGVLFTFPVSAQAQPWQQQVPHDIIAPAELDTADALKAYSTSSPQLITAEFMRAFTKGDYKRAALFVSSADPDSAELDRLMAIRPQFQKLAEWSLEPTSGPLPSFDKKNDDAGAPDQADISIGVGLKDDLDLAVWLKETVSFKREIIEGHRIWRIVPSSPDKVFTLKAEPPLVGRMAAYVALPVRTQEWLSMKNALPKVSKLIQALHQYQRVNGNTLPSSENLQKELLPYLETQGSFTSLLDPEKTQSFSLNPLLSEFRFNSIQNSAETVAIYEEKDGKPNFRYGGRAIIGYVDGHVRFVKPDEAKALIWKP